MSGEIVAVQQELRAKGYVKGSTSQRAERAFIEHTAAFVGALEFLSARIKGPQSDGLFFAPAKQTLSDKVRDALGRWKNVPAANPYSYDDLRSS